MKRKRICQQKFIPCIESFSIPSWVNHMPTHKYPSLKQAGMTSNPNFVHLFINITWKIAH